MTCKLGYQIFMSTDELTRRLIVTCHPRLTDSVLNRFETVSMTNRVFAVVLHQSLSQFNNRYRI